MSVIEISIVIRQSIGRVYELIKNMEQFPSFMKSVRKVEIIEKDSNRLITYWEVDLKGASVIWKEEDVFDDDIKSIKFRMIEGDYKDYHGRWLLKELNKKSTQVIISANFDWGIPAFEKFVGSVLERKARTLLKGMLKAIKREVELKT